MDHAIEYLKEYMDMDENEFIREWKSGEYQKISDCPSYAEVKAYCDAINILVAYYYGKEKKHYTITPRELIEYHSEE